MTDQKKFPPVAPAEAEPPTDSPVVFSLTVTDDGYGQFNCNISNGFSFAADQDGRDLLARMRAFGLVSTLSAAVVRALADWYGQLMERPIVESDDLVPEPSPDSPDSTV